MTTTLEMMSSSSHDHDDRGEELQFMLELETPERSTQRVPKEGHGVNSHTNVADAAPKKYGTSTEKRHEEKPKQ